MAEHLFLHCRKYMLLNPDRVTMNYTMADVVGLLLYPTLLIPAMLLPDAIKVALPTLCIRLRR